MNRHLFAAILAGLLACACLAQDAATPSDGQVLKVQRKLFFRGYQPGPCDGVLGPRTVRALESFQVEHGLRDTGTFTEDTLMVLGVDGLARLPRDANPPSLRLQQFLQAHAYLAETPDGLIGRKTWMALQTYLQHRGFYQGRVDGIAGPGTRDAIARLQRSLGIEETRLINDITVTALVKASQPAAGG